MSSDVVANDEEVFHDAEDSFAEKSDANEDGAVGRQAENAKETDLTEDQVPEISGTENVGDQMATSGDEIEEIPPEGDQAEEANEAEVPDQLENANEEDVVEEKTDAEQPDAEAKEEGAAEDVAATDEPAAESNALAEDAAEAEKVAPNDDAEAEVASQNEEENADAVEDTENAGEQEKQSVTNIPVTEGGPEPEGGEENTEDVAESEKPPAEDDFQLQDPPTPKRPKTPNELDEQGAEEAVDVEEGGEQESQPPATPKSSVKGSQPSTPAADTDEPVQDGVPGSPRRTSITSGAGTGVGSVPQTPKSPAASIRRESNASAPKSPLANGSVQPGTPAPATPRSGAAAPTPRTPKAGGETPKTKTEFVFEEASPVPTPKSPKKMTFDEEADVLSTSTTKSKSKSPPKSPRSSRKIRRHRVLKSPGAEPEPEGDAEAPVEENTSEQPEVEGEKPDEAGEDAVEKPEAAEPEAAEPETAEPEITELEATESEAAEPKVAEETESKKDEEDDAPPVTRSRARVQSPSPPPRGSARSSNREPAPRDYTPYDQDSHRETVPPRLPTSTSFSSWVAPERESYQAISPWVNTSGKYRNEHTTGVPSHTPTYTAFFDDLVSTGPFSHNLYATSRLLERSRSRTRERRSAMRSQRAASNYYRFASQHPPPLRTRDYSTPPTSAISRAPSRAGSFISFIEYSNAKDYDLARSRGSLYDSNQALSRASSRGNIDYYLGSGRISRVDSYVNNLNSRYEWHVPSNYETYRSASRSHISGYTPVNEYTSYANPLYEDARRVRDTGMVRSMYEIQNGILPVDSCERLYRPTDTPSLSYNAQQRYVRHRKGYANGGVGAVLPYAAPHDSANQLTRSLYSGFAQAWAQRVF